MYDAEIASQSTAPGLKMQRVKAHAGVRFGCSGGRTRLSDLYQSGSAKFRFPKVYDAPATAVLINTAGGLTGGDRVVVDATVDDGAHAIVTGQTAERAYRSTGDAADYRVRLMVGTGGSLEWLPQETILFDGSRLNRCLEADLCEGARFSMVETLVLGRKAMGERVSSVFFRDSWRIRRKGRLVFADDIRLSGDPGDFFGGSATGDGGLAAATFLDCDERAEDRINEARAFLHSATHQGVEAAASAWNGLLIARFISKDSRDLRVALMHFLTRYRSADLPRVWYC